MCRPSKNIITFVDTTRSVVFTILYLFPIYSKDEEPLLWRWRDSTVNRTLALYAANLG